jgi:hypothetical protein
MSKPLITVKDGCYNFRGFTYLELLSSLPNEMLRAKAQLANSLCHAYFHVNTDKELICQVMRDTERGRVVSARYYWNHIDGNWRVY